MVVNHNFTIFIFGYSMTKHLITDSRLKREFGNNGKTHSHLNLEAVKHLEYIYICNLKHLHKLTLKVNQVIKEQL